MWRPGSGGSAWTNQLINTPLASAAEYEKRVGLFSIARPSFRAPSTVVSQLHYCLHEAFLQLACSLGGLGYLRRNATQH